MRTQRGILFDSPQVLQALEEDTEYFAVKAALGLWWLLFVYFFLVSWLSFESFEETFVSLHSLNVSTLLSWFQDGARDVLRFFETVKSLRFDIPVLRYWCILLESSKLSHVAAGEAYHVQQFGRLN